MLVMEVRVRALFDGGGAEVKDRWYDLTASLRASGQPVGVGVPQGTCCLAAPSSSSLPLCLNLPHLLYHSHHHDTSPPLSPLFPFFLPLTPLLHSSPTNRRMARKEYEYEVVWVGQPNNPRNNSWKGRAELVDLGYQKMVGGGGRVGGWVVGGGLVGVLKAVQTKPGWLIGWFGGCWLVVLVGCWTVVFDADWLAWWVLA